MEKPSIARMPGVLAIAVVITLASFAVPARLLSQEPTLFRGHVDLVNVGVTVADKKRHLITSLDASDFAVYEDGRLQTIFAFARGEHTGPPLHVGVLVDVSGSQRADLPFTQTAAIRFMTLLADAVDITFIDFADNVRGARFPRSDLRHLVEHVRQLQAGGGTALYDAIGVYLDGAAAQDGRKVMVLYTDGSDTQSSLELDELMKLLKASDVTVYSIGALDNQPQAVRALQRAILADIADATGGTAFFAGSVKDLDRIYEQVLGEVRAQYTIGYLSTNEKTDGAWRKVEVKITRPDTKNLRVRARNGYYAPSKGDRDSAQGARAGDRGFP
jgi:Ca-activated chloride channel family protein